MALNASYDKEEDVPEAHKELFTERDGKWELTGITGMKTQADVDRVTDSLRKEREDHKVTREKLTVWGEMDHGVVAKDLDELREARVLLEGGGKATKIDEDKMEKLVEARVATQVAPIRRDLEKAVAENEELKGTVVSFQGKETTRSITDAVRKAAVGIKVIDTAMDDVLMLGERVFQVGDDGSVLTKDGVGCTPGIAPDIWLSEMQERRPHWWPSSQGGGANGSIGGGNFPKNPFSGDHWNMTEQGRAVRLDRPKAERMAKAAGTTIGGPKPVVKKSAAA